MSFNVQHQTPKVTCTKEPSSVHPHRPGALVISTQTPTHFQTTLNAAIVAAGSMGWQVGSLWDFEQYIGQVPNSCWAILCCVRRRTPCQCGVSSQMRLRMDHITQDAISPVRTGQSNHPLVTSRKLKHNQRKHHHHIDHHDTRLSGLPKTQPPQSSSAAGRTLNYFVAFLVSWWAFLACRVSLSQSWAGFPPSWSSVEFQSFMSVGSRDHVRADQILEYSLGR